MRKMTLHIEDNFTGTEEREDVEQIRIMGDDGRSLYYLSLTDDGELEISTGMAAKQDGKVKDTALIVKPKASNAILLTRPDYK